MAPAVSVVTVILDARRFLAEAIESILSQTFRDFEYVIVDFGSTDDSPKLALKYAAEDSRIKFHRIEPCSLTQARNAACSIAQGRYIAIMDADDVSLPDRLALQVEFMDEHPEIALLGALADSIRADGQPFDFRLHQPPSEHDEIRTALKDHCPFCASTAFFRREAFTAVGGYRVALWQSEDLDLWLRIAERFRCAALQQVVLKYRFHSQQLSLRKQREQGLCALAVKASARLREEGKWDPLDTASEITPELLTKMGVPLTVQHFAIAEKYRDWIRNMCRSGEYELALRTAIALLQTDLKHAEPWQVAKLHETVAGLQWRTGHHLGSIIAFLRAVKTRPVMLGRPLKTVLRRIRGAKAGS